MEIEREINYKMLSLGPFILVQETHKNNLSQVAQSRTISEERTGGGELRKGEVTAWRHWGSLHRKDNPSSRGIHRHLPSAFSMPGAIGSQDRKGARDSNQIVKVFRCSAETNRFLKSENDKESFKFEE